MAISKSLLSVSCVAFLAACQSSFPDYSAIRIPASYIVRQSSVQPSVLSQKPEAKVPEPKEPAYAPSVPAEPKPKAEPAHPAAPEKVPEKVEKTFQGEDDFFEIVYCNPEIKAKQVVINNVRALALEIQGYSGKQLYAVSLGKGGEDYWVGTADQIVQHDSRDYDNRRIHAAHGVGSNVRLRIVKPSLSCNGNWIDISNLELIVDSEASK